MKRSQNLMVKGPPWLLKVKTKEQLEVIKSTVMYRRPISQQKGNLGR